MTAVKKSPAGTKAAPAKKAAAGQEGRSVEEGRAEVAGQEGRRRPRRRRRPARPPAKKSATAKAPATKAAGQEGTGHQGRATKAPAKATPATKAAGQEGGAGAGQGRQEGRPRAARSARPSAPTPRTPKFLDAQRVLLLEERAIYAGQAVDLRAEADSLALEREPGDVQFDEESGEGGTVTVDRERNLALSAQATAAVEEIDDALKKIDRKTYGGCERCFQPIPKARLQALPFARLCVACKSGGLSRR